MIVVIAGPKGLAVWISLSSKKEFVKLKLLQSGQAHEHDNLSVFTVIYCTALCIYPFFAVVTMDCFVVIFG